MAINLRWLALLAIVCVLPILAAASHCVADEQISLAGATMGTTYHVKLIPPDSPPAIVDLQMDIETAFEEINDQMSSYRDDSEISRFNRAPPDEWFTISPATAKVVDTALELSRKTDGALDITVGPLVRLWHFGPPAGDDALPMKLEPPADDAIASALQRVGYQQLEVRRDPPALKKQLAELEVDVSSVAGGYAVDRICELLRQRGIGDFMVEIGGELRASGHRADGKPWRVAIERPLPNRRELLMSVALTSGALATAGDYRNYFEQAGRRYSHIINPKTGWPIEHRLGSVSVVADTCMMADAWDTALLVLGMERGFECAEKHGIAALFIARNDGEANQVRATAAWKSRFGGQP